MSECDTTRQLNGGFVALGNICEDFLDRNSIIDSAERVPTEALPKDAVRRLVHAEHMTTVLRRFHGTPVELKVLSEKSDRIRYSRMILLTLRGSDTVVEFGIARLNLDSVDERIRDEIVQGDTPLGDILINHDVHRRIDPKWYFRFSASSPVLPYFDDAAVVEAFGRVAIIHCDGKPVIQLLEIVAVRGEEQP